jgi:hypothetical protein
LVAGVDRGSCGANLGPDMVGKMQALEEAAHTEGGAGPLRLLGFILAFLFALLTRPHLERIVARERQFVS